MYCGHPRGRNCLYVSPTLMLSATSSSALATPATVASVQQVLRSELLDAYGAMAVWEDAIVSARVTRLALTHTLVHARDHMQQDHLLAIR